MGIVYFSHGRSHLVRLLVSLHSLRRHYQGDVAVFTTDTDAPELRAMADALNFRLMRIPLAQVRRNACYVTKSQLWAHSPFRASLFLDCDTVVVADPSPMIDMATDFKSCVLTQFSNWTTAGTDTIRGRISPWAEVVCDGFDMEAAVGRSLSAMFPAINTGVFAWHRDCQSFMEQWQKLTEAGSSRFICDEIAMQILAQSYDPSPMVLSDRWNCSPIYGVHRKSPVIWHMHGGKHLRPEAKPVWMPVYREAFDKNIADLQSWTDVS